MKRISVVAALSLALHAGGACGSSYDDLNAGIHFHNVKQWSDSISAFDKALAARDLLPAQALIAHLDRGLAHQELHEYGPALADYSASLALQPNNTMALFGRATVYLDDGKEAAAAADLTGLIARRPKLALAYTLRAAIDARLGKTRQSVTDSKQVLSMLPNDYVRSIAIGIIAWQAGETDVAQDNFAHAVVEGQGNVFAWLWLALTNAKAGKALPVEGMPPMDKSSWPGPIASFFAGDTSQEAVFAAAEAGDPATIRGRVCEASFYVGEWLLTQNKRAAAQPLIQDAANGCPTSFIEWSPAQIALAGLAR